MTEKTQAPAATTEAAGTVSEEDLLKSLKALETPKETTGEAAAPKVVTEALTKTAGEVVKEQAKTEDLKKALEEGGALSEFASLIGLHVDTSLGTLAKSVQAGAERDLAMISVMTSMKKSLDAMNERIEQFGNAPGGKPTSQTATKETPTTTVKVLEKTAGGGSTTEQDPEKKRLQVRGQIKGGLETLAKSLPVGSPEQAAIVQAAVKFETTGQIDDVNMQKAIGAFKK
jgi:PPE-repeat protein